MAPLVKLDLAFSAFMLECESRRLTQSTLDFYGYMLTPFFEWCQAQELIYLQEITATHIRTHLVSLQRRDLSASTQHAFARSIRAFLNFCVSEEWLEKSPMDKVRMPKRDKKILPAFSKDDVEKLLAHANSERDKAIILCLLDSGCRASEFCDLNGEDIDVKTGKIWVRGGKGRKDRVTFIGTRSRKQLLRYYIQRDTPEENEAVWLSRIGGDRLTRSGLRQLLVRIGKRAGVDSCTPHTFRRTFALWSLRSGMNIFALQQLMGHSDLSVLKKYLALVEQDLEDAHQSYGAVDTML